MIRDSQQDGVAVTVETVVNKSRLESFRETTASTKARSLRVLAILNAGAETSKITRSPRAAHALMRQHQKKDWRFTCGCRTKDEHRSPSGRANCSKNTYSVVGGAASKRAVCTRATPLADAWYESHELKINAS